MAIIDEITPNEKRTALGYDQLKDPNMDKIYFRSGKIPLDELNAMEEDVDEEALTQMQIFNAKTNKTMQHLIPTTSISSGKTIYESKYRGRFYKYLNFCK